LEDFSDDWVPSGSELLSFTSVKLDGGKLSIAYISLLNNAAVELYARDRKSARGW
jgi:hypothetical protein